MSSMIALNKLCKAFSGKVILRDLDLEIEKGHSLVVIGGSGTGKSVLLKCIMNLIHPDSGTVHVGGDDVTNIAIHRRQGPKLG
jgi:ABC-type transport system involved in resistance to organic solvents, ATPase component